MQDRWAAQAKGVSDFCHLPLIFLPILQLSQNKWNVEPLLGLRTGQEGLAEQEAYSTPSTNKQK